MDALVTPSGREISQLKGYSLAEKLYDGSRTIVYRGVCDSDQRPIIVKFLKDEFPSFKELVQFSNQFSIAKDLNLPTIVKPIALIPCGKASALVMEDYGGLDLKLFLKERSYCPEKQDKEKAEDSSEKVEDSSGKLDSRLGNTLPGLILFFQIAIQVAEALEGLCQANIIHKDIKPANILIHPESHQVKLIDFSIASLLPRENQETRNPSVLEGTLSYLSPEQTGRMNRGIDYRSDFYSLGVTCYELLTGQLPFTAEDPMEVVHGHLARQPIEPHHLLTATLPKTVSAIVLKLMAKNAEDRYQSTFGLKHDLEKCLHQLQETGQIEPFEIGREDVSDRFLLCEKLYGRQSQVAHLLAAFSRVSQGNTELMLIAGSSGIGKTAVVNEVHKPIAHQRGYFIQGKYDQLQRNVPLSAFIQAFRSLIKLLLSESDAQLAQWQRQIFKVLGRNGQVLIDVIPELEGLIGPQPPAAELSAIAAENRFNRLMQKFVQVFTGPQHPLVIFLDDLQWADAASLKLLQHLMQDDGHLLIIGAYRDNEVAANHPLILTLEDIREARTALAAKKQAEKEQAEKEQAKKEQAKKEQTIELDNTGEEFAETANIQDSANIQNNANINLLVLSPLSAQNINHLVADTLHCAAAFAQPLAELIYQKTHGNPFFSAQYLTALQAEGNITFNAITRQWQYDLAKINATSPSNDVLEFMRSRLTQLPTDTQTSLQFAACIGAQFDLATLAIAAQRPAETMATDLWCALQAGLIVPTSESYKAFMPSDTATLEAVNPTYRFFHDHIQQAAYALMTPEQKATIHRTIGERLLQNSSTEQQEQQLFNIVNHLNQGTALVQGGASFSTGYFSTEDLIELNLRAGHKAKGAIAYAAAFDYLTKGISWLPESRWQTHYNLALTLHNEAAEAAYLTGNLVVMQQHIDQILKNSPTLLDKIRVYETQIQATIGQNHFLQGIEITLSTLDQLGVNIPRQPELSDIQQTLKTTANNISQQINQQPIHTLIELPEMEDPQSLVIIRLLAKAVSSAYIAKPEVLPLLVCTGINRCLKFGNSPLSAFLYGWYGVILCGLPEDMHQGHQMGHQMGQLALALLEKIPSREIQSRVISLVYFLLNPWKSHIKESLSPLQKTYHSGLENGDTEYAAWAIAVYCHYAYLAGHNLENLTNKIARYRNSVSKLAQDAAFNYLSLYQQVTLNLLGHSAAPTELEGDAYSEAATLPIQMAANDLTGVAYLHINKGILAYLFAKPQAAQKSFDKALNYLPGVSSSQWMAALLFYDAIACLALSPEHLPRAISNQQKIKTWAKLSPSNHLHRWHLIEAERCRLTGDKSKAIDHYDQAIALAGANGFIQEEALASELAAQFYLMWGKGRIAQSYMLDAYYAYSRWGAAAKIADLEKRYPQLLEATLNKRQQGLSSTDTMLAYANTQSTTTTSSGLDEVIDLATLLHTAQVLSSEIELEKLLVALLDAVIHNAGADKCALLMPKEHSSKEHSSKDSSNSIETAPEKDASGKDTAWVIEAYSVLGQPRILLQSKAIKPGELLPVSLINQVRRTCEPAVIFNAAVHAALTVDPYVLRHQPKSVLCIPILNQGKLIAILYLENNLTIGAFTDNRLEVLNLICTQAAISLENARLYYQAQQAFEELKNSHMQLVQSEKMSALGNLVAGVAHEINNPVNFLKGNLKPALSYVQDLLGVLALVAEDEPREVILEEMEEINLDFIREDLPNLLHSMTFGISRIQDISTSLRTFSRADKDYKTAFNLHEGLDSTLLILKHRLQFNDSSLNSSGVHRPPIQVIKNYASLPDIHCFAGQLNQVFMNLIANAIEAISEIRTENEIRTESEIRTEAHAGEITITTALVDEQAVSIAIADNGPGMEESIKVRVFDHLFTTKPVGKGTGLGLAISYAIVVEKHGGTLTVNSEPGKGTKFVITLPVAG